MLYKTREEITKNYDVIVTGGTRGIGVGITTAFLNAGASVVATYAGIRRDQIIPSMYENDWDAVIDTNLKGTSDMTRFGVLTMMRNRYGRIVNMSSVGGKLGLPGQANASFMKGKIKVEDKTIMTIEFAATLVENGEV